MTDTLHTDGAIPHGDTAQVERLEKKMVAETEKAGGTVHEFNPDESPQQKAAGVKKVRNTILFLESWLTT